MSSQKRGDIWKSMLDAEMNECYWSDEARIYGSWARGLSVGAAILSSSTVVALFASPTWHDLAGKVLAAVASIISIWHTTFYGPARLKQIAGLAGRWKDMAIEYRLLWSKVEDDESPDDTEWNKYEALSKSEKEIDESGFNVNRKRLREAQAQVMRRRGLLNEQQGKANATTTPKSATAS